MHRIIQLSVFVDTSNLSRSSLDCLYRPLWIVHLVNQLSINYHYYIHYLHQAKSIWAHTTMQVPPVGYLGSDNHMLLGLQGGLWKFDTATSAVKSTKYVHTACKPDDCECWTTTVVIIDAALQRSVHIAWGGGRGRGVLVQIVFLFALGKIEFISDVIEIFYVLFHLFLVLSCFILFSNLFSPWILGSCMLI